MDLLGAYASSNEDDDAMEEVVEEPSSAAPQPLPQESGKAGEGTQVVEEAEEPTEGQDTRAGKRIAELNEVEEVRSRLAPWRGVLMMFYTEHRPATTSRRLYSGFSSS